MSEPNPGSWVSRILGWCLGLLVAAMALCSAVSIVEGIWPQLCIGAGIVAIVVGIVAIIRRRSRF